MKTQLPCLRLGNSETNLPSRAPLQDQADATSMGTILETAPSPGFFLPCPASLTPLLVSPGNISLLSYL